MMFFNGLSGLILTVLATQASAGTFPSSSADCPAPGRLNTTLQNLLESLESITINFQSAVNLTERQCPCVSGDSECFETRAETLLSDLQQLTADVEAAQTNVSFECPDRTGAVLVATCGDTNVIVVDPNGFIQNGLTTAFPVERWTLAQDGDGRTDAYALDYYNNLGRYRAQCKPVPGVRELTLARGDDSPLTSSARGTGVAINIDNVRRLYAAISFDETNLNGIYFFDRLKPRLPEFVCNYNGTTGDIFICNGYIYMNDGQSVVKKPITGGTWEEVLVFSAPPLDLVVQDDGSVVFCDDAGAVYVYDPNTTEYVQLKRPNADDCCSSVKISPCNSLIFIAFKNDPVIQIYNATSLTSAGTLTYTDSTPSPCPRIEFDPRFCCA